MPVTYCKRNGRLVYFCDHCDGAEIFSLDDNESFIGRKAHRGITKHLYEAHPEIWKLTPDVRKVYQPEAVGAVPQVYIEPTEKATPTGRKPKTAHAHVWACVRCGALPSPEDLKAIVTQGAA